MQTTPLNHKFTHTVEQIFQHPASHNLEWNHVVALMKHLGTVEAKENGHLLFTVQGASVSFHRSVAKDVSDVQQTLDLRHFLESVGIGVHGITGNGNGSTGNTTVALAGEARAAKRRLLVVVTQEETRVFRSESRESMPEHFTPYDPHGTLPHLNQVRGRDAEAQAPANTIYYEKIAETLEGADEVLLMGNGVGSSSAIVHLREYLTKHHHEIAERIVGAETLDVEALTEGQLLQEARAFFARRDVPNEADVPNEPSHWF